MLAEPEPLGTGGALAFAREGPWAERFFFLNGDSLFDVNLWDLALRPSTGPARGRATTGSPPWPCAAWIRRRALWRLPCCSDGAITGFKRAWSGRAWPDQWRRRGVRRRRSSTSCRRTGPCSIESVAYPELARTGQTRGEGPTTGPFIDIGVPDDYARAPAWVAAHIARGAVIFDRDGVLNHDVGYAHLPEHIIWTQGAAKAVKAVNDAGLFAFVATNQAGVARGYYGEAEVHALHAWMNAALAAEGAHIDAFALSPFHPEGTVERFSRASECRKPAPGMLTDLLTRHPVAADRTVMIGDRPTDMAAADAAGVRGVLFKGGDLASVVEPLLPGLI